MSKAFCPCCSIGLDNNQMREKHCNNCGHDWEIWHVIPYNDIKDHVSNCNCSCDPTVSNEGANMVAIHNSFDGREGVEWANEILEK